MSDEIVSKKRRDLGRQLRKMATTQARSGRRDTAVETLELALLVEPTSPELFEQWAKLETERGNPIQAAVCREMAKCMR